MEIIIEFIFGVTVVAFVINFLALTGYLIFKLRDVIYTKYKINILGALYYASDRPYYVDYIFTGLFSIGIMLFLFGSVYMTCQLGNYIYSLS